MEPLLDYFFRSPRELPAIQNIDFERFPQEPLLRQQFHEHMRAMTIVAVEYLGRAIGTHFLNEMRGNHAEFHAHFWSADARGKGIGAISWYRACQHFFDVFPALDMLYFKSPKTNPFAGRLVKKLPLKFIGEEESVSTQLKPGTRVDVYSLSRSDFERLHNEDDLDDDDSVE